MRERDKSEEPQCRPANQPCSLALPFQLALRFLVLPFLELAAARQPEGFRRRQGVVELAEVPELLLGRSGCTSFGSSYFSKRRSARSRSSPPICRMRVRSQADPRCATQDSGMTVAPMMRVPASVA